MGTQNDLLGFQVIERKEEKCLRDSLNLVKRISLLRLGVSQFLAMHRVNLSLSGNL